MEGNEAVPQRMKPPDDFAEGVWVKMNGRREYLVPALPLGVLKRMRTQIATAGDFRKGELPSEEMIGTIVEVLHAALKINYPDLTVEQAETFVTTKNFIEIFSAVMNVTGMEKKPGEVVPAK